MITVTIADDALHHLRPENASDSRTFELLDLHHVADLIDSLRTAMIFDHDKLGGLSRYAEQHFLTALSHLDIAQRHFRMGWMEELEQR